jgi:UTP--glucose-1-phosphate uridylyltransferase
MFASLAKYVSIDADIDVLLNIHCKGAAQMKVIIPVAGLGTRMLPATKAIPKEMLPVVDKPLIQYVVSEAVAAGATSIVLVTHASKNSVENHFDTSFELEATLEKRVKRQLLEDVQSICPKGVSIISVRQGEPRGLGHAILCAKPVVGEDDFAVILPDVLIDDAASDPKKDNLANMITSFRESGRSQIMVEAVPDNDVDKYGVVGLDNTHTDRLAINELVEKPDKEQAPSNLAIVGRYVLSRDIWPLLERTPLGAGNEIQLTDAIKMLVEQNHATDAVTLKGQSHDCGSKAGLMKANITYALRHPEIGLDIRDFIRNLKL